jgi:hypothetical protein
VLEARQICKSTNVSENQQLTENRFTGGSLLQKEWIRDEIRRNEKKNG